MIAVEFVDHCAWDRRGELVLTLRVDDAVTSDDPSKVIPHIN